MSFRSGGDAPDASQPKVRVSTLSRLTVTGRGCVSLLGRHGLAIVTFASVFVTLTWPLALHFDSAILGSVVGDGWKTVEQFWWYKHAIIDQRVSPLYDPNIFYPQGWYTATSSHSLGLMLPTVPLTMATNPIAAYNLTMWWSFVFAALGMYTLIYRLTCDRLAGTLGGISYAFCMSRLLRAAGHLNVSVGSAWIPWIFVCLENARCSESRRWRFAWAALAGSCYAGSMFGYWYFVYLVAIPLAAYWLIELWQVRRDRAQLRSTVGMALLTFAVGGALVAPLAILTLQARAIAGVVPFGFEDTIAFAASLERFVLPNRYHPIWGAWMVTFFRDRGEQDFVFLGLAATFLAGGALLRRVHARCAAYGLVAMVGLIMALGPALQWGGAPITLHLPGLSPNATIPLPGLLLYQYAPMFNVIRVWARFSLIVSLAVGVLAALALAHLRTRIRWGRAVGVILIALVWLESFGHPFGIVPTAAVEREVDRWLAAQPGQFAIVELPLKDRLNGSLMYSRMLHDKQLALGYTAALPRHFAAAVPAFAGFPNQETVEILRGWNVRYLLYTVHDQTLYGAHVAPVIEELHGLEFVAEFGENPGEQVYVYAIAGAATESGAQTRKGRSSLSTNNMGLVLY